MGNVIKIKRGQGAPGDGVLEPYELGIDTETGTLYCGTEGPAIPVGSGGGSSGGGTTSQPLPTTRLMKRNDSETGNQVLQIYCYNLNKTTPYTLKLYTMQKNRGNKHRYWRHPENLDPTDPDINWTSASGKYTGYKNLVGSTINGTSMTYPEPPSWMNNQGILQSEWDVPQPTQGNALIFEINLNEWISDLLKYYPNEEKWLLMGVHSKQGRRDHYSRYFQFRLCTPLGAVGPTENTLAISRAYVDSSSNSETGDDVQIGYFSIK